MENGDTFLCLSHSRTYFPSVSGVDVFSTGSDGAVIQGGWLTKSSGAVW